MTRLSTVVVTGLGVAVRGLTGAADLLRGRPGDPAAPDPVDRLTGRGLRFRDRATRLAMVACGDALADARLLDAVGPATPDASFGVVTSSNLGNIDTICDAVATIDRETYLGTSPMSLPATSSNVIASWLAITHGLQGANLTLCNGPTSGLDAVHWARLLIASGRVSRVVVVGVEPDLPEVRWTVGDGADHVGPLFDGAVAVVLEEAGAADARGTRVLARFDRYSRRGSRSAAVASVLVDGERIGLWLPPDGGDSPAAQPDAAVHDLSAVLGPASGALGVAQVAAASAWLDDGRTRSRALGVCGSDDDAAAALMLAGADAA